MTAHALNFPQISGKPYSSVIFRATLRTVHHHPDAELASCWHL